MKVGGGFGGIDAGAIAKAEEALKAMSAQFGQWLQDEIDKLDKARADIRTRRLQRRRPPKALYFRAHDLKGLGTTYQYPLVTRIAGSLCRLMDDADQAHGRAAVLLDAHIDAIKAVVRDKIQTDDHPVGKRSRRRAGSAGRRAPGLNRPTSDACQAGGRWLRRSV